MTRLYMDICCFNRPFDDQSQRRVRLEAEAKLSIQDSIREGEVELIWSYLMDFENRANPFRERRESIAPWRALSVVDLSETPEIVSQAKELNRLGFKAKDSLHLSCALAGQSELFLTTDDGILKKRDQITDLAVMNPVDYPFSQR